MRHVVLLTALLGAACREEEPPTDGDPTDTSEPTGPTDTSEPTEPTEPIGDPLPLVFNEIVPGNRSTVAFPGSDDKPDWIELLNVGTEPIPLNLVQIRNSDGAIWTGGDGEIAPGQYFVVWAGEPLSTDGWWTGFAIDKDNDKLTLLTDGAVADFVDIEEVPSDVSLARIPDGTGALVPTAWTTFGVPNGEAASPTLDPADETWFRTDVIHRIDFTFTPQAYDAINLFDRPMVHVEAEIDGIPYADIGLKLKGSASYDTMDGKPAFLVDLNVWEPDNRFRGLRAFKLHNGKVLDPTRVRDHLSYKLAREAGLMSPRVGWAQVYCNGIDYGLYVIVERHDEAFIEYHRPESKETGMVFEPNESRGGGWGWGDFGGPSLDWDYEEGPLPPDPLGVTALNEANRLIGSPATDDNVAELWNHFEKDAFLTYLAWESVVSHTDGYKAPNNWRVYVDGVTHKVELLPSGVEWTWDSAPSLWWFGGAAGNWCLQNAGCRREYAEKVLEVADLADSLNLDDEFMTLSTWLDPLIDADVRWNGWQTVEQARSTTYPNLQSFPTQARTQVYQEYPDLRP